LYARFVGHSANGSSPPRSAQSRIDSFEGLAARTQLGRRDGIQRPRIGRQDGVHVDLQSATPRGAVVEGRLQVKLGAA
jgi:hypothetical protein